MAKKDEDDQTKVGETKEGGKVEVNQMSHWRSLRRVMIIHMESANMTF